MAQFFFDFSGIGTGSGLPAGWTVRWDNGATWTRSTGPRINGDSANNNNNFAGWDTPGLIASGDFDILARGRTTTTGFNGGPGIGYGTGGTSWAGFLLKTENTGDISLQRWSAGSYVTENAGTLPYTMATGTDYWLRLRRVGSTVYARSWAGAIGDEPGTWQATLANDADANDGYASVWSAGSFLQKEYNFFSVGTGADLAPTSAPTTATQLAFSTQPQNTVISTAMPSVVVQARDSGGVLDAAYTGNVTIALQTGSGTLSGTLTRAAVGGVATFTGLSINALNTGAVLRATASGLTLADSNTFNIVAAATSGVGSRVTSRFVV